jgi:[ribosomal protein S5]-alanine N-acetyltransferase
MISTSRLLLRSFSLDDVPKIFAMSLEEGMRRWIPDQVYRDEQHAEAVLRALIACTDQAPEPAVRPYVLGVERKDDGSLIGHVGLSAARGSVEIGYAIEQRLQRQGFATEAVTAMCEWATAELLLPEVLGIVEVGNVHSCRVLEKAGFVKSGEDVRHASDGSVARTLAIYRYARANVT